MALNDIYRIRIKFHSLLTGKGMTAHLDVRQDDLVAPTMSAMGDNVKDWWDTAGDGAAAKTRHADNLSLTEVTLQRIKPLEAVVQSYTTGLPIAGTLTTHSLPPRVSTVVSYRTANIGRSYRGRTYLPPVGEVDSDGNLDATIAADYAAQFNGLLQTMVVDDAVPTVFSPTLDAYSDIVSTKLDRIFRTQRRRGIATPTYVSNNV